jgi:hypothetical protein
VALSVFGVVVLLDSLELWTAGIEAGVTLYLDDLACAALLAGVAIVATRRRTFPRLRCCPVMILLTLVGVNAFRSSVQMLASAPMRHFTGATHSRKQP